MTNTYLIEVIKAMEPIKQQEMALLLGSPLFNKFGNAKEMAKLYQLIIETAPGFSEELLSKEKVYFQVFSDKKIVSRKLDKLMGDLNKALRTYALVKRYLLDSNEEQQQIHWAEWLRERGVSERSKKVIAKLKTTINQDKPESLDSQRTNLLIAEEEHEWESVNNKVRGDLNIPNLIYNLDLFYHTYRTELTNRYLLQQKGAQLPDWALEDAKIDYYEEESKLLKITRLIHEMLRKDSPSTEDFQGLVEVLHRCEDTLSFQTLAQFYAFLRSTCNILINEGFVEFFPVLHEIHKHNLKQKYFFINGEISPHAFISIVLVATRANDFTWAKAVTEQYKNHLIGGDEGQFYYRLNMAHCYFAEGDFEEASNSIPDMPFNSYYHQIVRRLELKIYYELHSELLPYKIDSFRKFIERTAPKTISANLRAMNVNFLNILSQLYQSPPKDKTRSERLVERIQSKKLVADRSWLLEKAQQLA